MTWDGTGESGDGATIHIMQQENCRIAYTLNNSQPVRCSIIGDQPLFYMDFDAGLEDEFIDESDPFGIAMIEAGVEALKNKIMASDFMATGESALSEAAQIRLADFIDDSINVFSAGRTRGDSGAFRLKAIEKMLEQSRLCATHLEVARQYGIGMAFSTLVELAYYDREAKTIFLNPDRDDTDLTLLAMRELRRVWQHKNGALLNPLTFHPDQAILVNRAQQADLCVMMLRGAWDLQLAGSRAAWDRLENSAFEDLARAMAREAYLDFRSLNNGQAAYAVFEAWFMSDRCRVQDRKLIQNMLADYQGYVFENEQASRSITTDLMVALGSQPVGKNYLSATMTLLLGDPLFTEVRDRSNANFLWFIKFERSFREAEQELQTSPAIQAADVLPGHNNEKTDGDDAKNSTVIALPGVADRPVFRDGRTGTGPENGGGTVVYFDPGRKLGGKS